MSIGPNVVIVFAKYPQPGRVKTRLIGPLTAAQAAEVHLRCLRVTLQCVAAVEGVDVVLASSPGDADFQELLGAEALDGVPVWPQSEGDLGERLRAAVDRAFGEGAGRVLMVGSDCPGMMPADVSRAVRELDRHDVVIGPALDGGYYLLGLRRRLDVLFESVEWSSPRVLTQTLARASAAGLTVAFLPERRDVDDYGDIMALAGEDSDEDDRLREFKAFLRALIANGGDRGRA
jgi:rSAM/selenodomain-associated transferase 1